MANTDGNSNLWDVSGLEVFNFLCCPECVYRSKEESSFQSHALKNHPRSKILFKPEQTQKSHESYMNLCYCCPECVYKSEDVNLFQIHALQNHPRSFSFFTDESCNREDESKNPWGKVSIEEFCFLCCSKCEFVSKESSTFKKHIVEQHSVSKPDQEGSKVNIGSFVEMDFQCGVCGNNFTQETNLMSHIANVHKEYPLKLDPDQNFVNDHKIIDSKIVLTEDQIKVEDGIAIKSEKITRSIKIEKDTKYIASEPSHNGAPTSKKRKQKNVLHTCSFCPEQYSFHEMRKHKRTAHTQVPCDECNEIFANPFILNRHKYYKHVVSKQQKIKATCEICGLMVAAPVLKRHIMSRQG